MNKIWAYVTGAFTFLLGLFLYEREKKLDAEAKLDNAETNKTDATLNQHTQDLQQQMQQDLQQEQQAKQQNVSQEDLLKFLNKK